MTAVSGVASDRIPGAAYAPMAERLAEGSLPDYLVVSYDVRRATVVLAEFIDGDSIDALRVHARTALGPTRGEPDGSAPRSILPDSSGES
jgi:hypothetical protein